MHSSGHNMIHWSLVYTLGSFVMIIPVSTEDREFPNRLTNYYLLKLDSSIQLLLLISFVLGPLDAVKFVFCLFCDEYMALNRIRVKSSATDLTSGYIRVP